MMRHLAAAMFLGGLLFILIALGSPAHACLNLQPVDLAGVRKADAVVIGRISNYAFILDPVIRQKYAKNYPDSSPELLETLRNRPSFATDYARFDLQIDEILVGEVGQTIDVILYGSWIGPPESMPPGLMLIALKNPNSGYPEPGAFRALQGPCSNPFIFSSTGAEASEIRKILNR
jgi:hypothetical protein